MARCVGSGLRGGSVFNVVVVKNDKEGVAD